MKRLFDSSINIEVRLFYVLAWTAAIANTIGFIANYVFYGLSGETVFCMISAGILYLCGFFGISSKKPYPAAYVILAVINICEFPILYYQHGASRTGYMFLGIVGLLVFLPKVKRQMIAIVTILYDTILIIFYEIHRREMGMAAIDDEIGAVIVTFFVSAVSITLIILILIKQYEEQNDALMKMTMELQEMATLDPLTLIYNRRFLTDYLDKKISNSEKAFAVALMDLDDFKSVNDRFGHVYGDQVLQEFANSMKKHIQEKGIASRFGGEEFMLVFDDPDRELIKTIMDKIQSDLSTFSQKTQGIGLSFSGGVEVFNQEDKITQLFNAADEKLYVAKKTGKHKVIFEKE